MSLFSTRCIIAFILSLGIFSVNLAQAMDFDWKGQFTAETNWLFGYSHGLTKSTTADRGYFIPQNGDSPATFQILFLKLNPRAIVNDNVTIRSDFWLGSPSSVFGGDTLGTGKSYYYTTQTGRASITANALYAEVATDFGTLIVGRAPLNWGLGLIWNNTDSPFQRFPSTGDSMRLITKLGSFKFMPGIVKYQNGSNYGGTAGYTAGALTSTIPGGSGVTDYTAGLTYENPDEQIELGVLFMRRLTGLNAQIVNPYSVDTIGTTTSYNYNVWDFYVKKKAGILTIAGEIPLVSGQVNATQYSTVAGAVKVDAQVSEKWVTRVNVGMADGQGVATPGTNPQFTAFYFHPDYRPGFIMFNYNLRNLSDGTVSPYYNPLTNAQFLTLGADYHGMKWSHGFQWVYARANKVADGVAGNRYFNSWDGIYKTENAGATEQDKGLGSEFDYMLGYQWDEALRFGLDIGLYFPGKFYEFSNTATLNAQKTVFGTNLNMSVKF